MTKINELCLRSGQFSSKSVPRYSLGTFGLNLGKEHSNLSFQATQDLLFGVWKVSMIDGIVW